MADDQNVLVKAKKPRLRLVLFAVFSLLCMWAVIEVIARVSVSYNSLYPQAHDKWRLPLHTNLFHQWDQADSIELSRLNCETDEICSESVFVPRRKEPGRQRIVCLGSSSTRGAGLRHWRQLYPAKLEEKLRAAGYDVEVINAGCGGYNSYQLWIYLSEVLVLLEPDIVVFYYGCNEAYGHSVKVFYPRVRKIVSDLWARGVTDPDRLQFAVQHGTADPRALWLSRILEYSRAVAWFSRRVVQARIIGDEMHRRDASQDDQPLTAPTLETILLDMVSLAKQTHSDLLLCPEASTSDQHGEAPGLKEDNKEGYNHRVMMKVCGETTAVCLDPVADQPGLNSLSYFLDSTHLTEEGHERLAETLLPAVKQTLDRRIAGH